MKQQHTAENAEASAVIVSRTIATLQNLGDLIQLTEINILKQDKFNEGLDFKNISSDEASKIMKNHFKLRMNLLSYKSAFREMKQTIAKN